METTRIVQVLIEAFHPLRVSCDCAGAQPKNAALDVHRNAFFRERCGIDPSKVLQDPLSVRPPEVYQLGTIELLGTRRDRQQADVGRLRHRFYNPPPEGSEQ